MALIFICLVLMPSQPLIRLSTSPKKEMYLNYVNFILKFGIMLEDSLFSIEYG